MRKAKRLLTEQQAAELNARNAAAWKTAPKHSTAQAKRAAVKPRAPSEAAECRTFVAWTKMVNYLGEPLYERVVKIPNERGKAGVYTAILSAIGMRTGFQDYLILAPLLVANDDPTSSMGIWKPCGGLLLEAKKIGGDTHDTDQEAWRVKALRFGYHAEICEGAIALIDATRRYFSHAPAGAFIDRTRVS